MYNYIWAQLIIFKVVKIYKLSFLLNAIIRLSMKISFKIRKESIYQMTLEGYLNFKIQIEFTLFTAISKIAVLEFGLFVDKNIFAMDSINNSYCKYLFC